jgi:hypothetical protein
METPIDAAATDAGAIDAAIDDAPVSDGGPALAPVEHATIIPRADPCVAAPAGEYGPITAYDRDEVDNPTWTAPHPKAVQVLVPSGGGATHPVIVYAHPFGGDDWTRVRTYLEILVSRDHVVVFPPYPVAGEPICERYDTLRGGIQRASAALGSLMDTTRVGFIGHSFGAGATPWLAHEAVVVDGWGSAGLFLYVNAPWYLYRMEPGDWADFPEATRLSLMLFEDDDTNDHRIGIEQIWTPFPRAEAFRMLRSSTHGSCAMTADHIVPATDSTLPDAVRFNALDTWGTIRYARALADCTLRADASACATIDGNASGALQMGRFADDGSDVPPMITSETPTPAHDESFYMFPISNESMYVCTPCDLI